jgi:hypothetical protein
MAKFDGKGPMCFRAWRLYLLLGLLGALGYSFLPSGYLQSLHYQVIGIVAVVAISLLPRAFSRGRPEGGPLVRRQARARRQGQGSRVRRYRPGAPWTSTSSPKGSRPSNKPKSWRGWVARWPRATISQDPSTRRRSRSSSWPDPSFSDPSGQYPRVRSSGRCG